MKRLYFILFLFYTLISCQAPRSGTEMMYDYEETVSNQKEEANIEEVKPRLELMATAARESLTAREISDPVVKGEKVRSLRLWSDGDSWPVVLEVTYPADGSDPSAVYYFRDRQLLAVEKENANFILKKDKLQVWADQNWEPLKNKSTAQWLDQENYLLNNAKKYLNAFEINYEE
jgi:hypothetical protein